MGDLPKKKMMVSLWRMTYPSGKNDSLIVMSDLPKEKNDGLIVMGDLPRKDDSLIVMGDPNERWSKCELVSLLWVTYPNERWKVVSL